MPAFGVSCLHGPGDSQGIMNTAGIVHIQNEKYMLAFCILEPL